MKPLVHTMALAAVVVIDYILTRGIANFMLAMEQAEEEVP